MPRSRVSRRFIALGLCALSALACGGSASSSTPLPGVPPIPPMAPRFSFAPLPAGFQVELVSSIEGAARAHLVLDPSGRPYGLVDDAFVPLKKDARLSPFKVKNATGVSGYAWVDEGVLLLAAGLSLGVVTPDGFAPLLTLPSPGMRLARAGADKCWVFGGEGDLTADLFLYAKGGTIAHALRAPKPIRAVAGKPDRFVVATEGSILELAVGSAPSLLFDGPSDVVALDVADHVGVFFSNADGLFLRGADGKLTRVLKDAPSEIRVADDAIYLLMDGVGVLRGAPLKVFARGGEP